MTAVTILTELLRLYDWRFKLAEREKDPRNATEVTFRSETRRLLNQYGTEKKAAWEAARAILGQNAQCPTCGATERDGNPLCSNGWHIVKSD